jgi:hypothetical protein
METIYFLGVLCGQFVLAAGFEVGIPALKGGV